MAILSDAQLEQFHALATEAGLAVLVEVHDEAELTRAENIGAQLIGVNNRDLKTFKVDLGTTERLAKKMEDRELKMAKSSVPSSLLPPSSSPLLVAESGINTRADVERLERCGAKAILVGESLIKGGDISAKVSELLG